VIENEFVKPGKGQAFNRIKVRNLKTGRTIERTFKSGESLEAADVVDTGMQYLYHDGEFWHFMVPESFEQYTAGKSAVGENAQWFKDGVVCIVTLWNNVPLVVMASRHSSKLPPVDRSITVSAPQRTDQCSFSTLRWSTTTRARHPCWR